MTEAQVEAVARALYHEAQLEAFKLGAPKDVPDFDNDDEDSRGFCRRMARAAIAALAATTRSDEWTPHLDYAGEPMQPGEFRDPPDADEDAEWLRENAADICYGGIPLRAGARAEVKRRLERIASRLKPDAELREENKRLKAENDRLSKAVCSGILGDLLSTDESDALVQFIRELRSAHESDGVQHG